MIAIKQITSKLYALCLNDEESTQTIKSVYHQSAPSNFMRGGTFGATGIIEVTKCEKKQ